MTETVPPNVVCVQCGSPRMIWLRHDSDWGGGNSPQRANDDSLYEAGDCDPNNGDDLDIEIIRCLACGAVR